MYKTKIVSEVATGEFSLFQQKLDLFSFGSGSKRSECNYADNGQWNKSGL